MKISSYYLLLMSEEFFVFYHVYCLCSKYIPCLHSGYLFRDVCINPVNSYGHSKVYKRKFNAQEHTVTSDSRSDGLRLLACIGALPFLWSRKSFFVKSLLLASACFCHALISAFSKLEL